MSKYKEFENRIGYEFNDRALLELALSHPIQEVTLNNERLEFLGDRVLGLILADYLVAAFPDDAEGHLARRLAHLGSGLVCGQIAQSWGLDAFIIRAEEKLTERVLSNFCEAIIGAIYLDRGLESAKTFILTHWGARLQEKPFVDPKTQLQEWSMQAGHGLPSYKKLSQTGPAHEPMFLYEVLVENVGTARGEGGSRRQAEQSAAAALLSQLEN